MSNQWKCFLLSVVSKFQSCGEIESMHEFEVAELINLPFEEKTVILYKNKKISIIHQFKYKVKKSINRRGKK